MKKKTGPMTTLTFRPLTLADGDEVRRRVLTADCRNCDLNFMNLMSWRFLFDTELAIHDEWLLLRFRLKGQPAYLAPVGDGDWNRIMEVLRADAEANGHPFLMMGVCEHRLALIEQACPGCYRPAADPAYADYIYLRTSLASLAGKALQPKRNHVNRFLKTYPDYEYQSLTADLFEECMALEDQWAAERPAGDGWLSFADERRSVEYVLRHWDELHGLGGALRVGGRLVAFTYGAPINHDTFDVCVEKADTAYDGAYAFINREFARHIPEQYVYVNREEDLGVEGLRRAKMSYRPERLLQKYSLSLSACAGS